jgi:uncharacterized protein
MTLCDTGPLVALINAGDAHHHRCTAALPHLSSPLLTTWPCLTETMYLLTRYGGYPAQEELWAYVEDGLLTLHTSSEGERARMHVLMQQYRDTPMDLADASLVAAAEALNVVQVFTLDSHFYAYRIAGARAFTVVP